MTISSNDNYSKNQAMKLQKLVEQKSNEASPKRNTHFITVTSGKGGVGKSTISANLAYIFAKYGYKVGIFDADIGLANLDVLFNVKIKKNIVHVLNGQASVEDILVQITPNLTLIPGDSGAEIFEFTNTQMFASLIEDAKILDNLDLMIIDTGAGIGEKTQTFLNIADDIIVVTVPDPAAITDAYATIKMTSKTRNNIGMVLNQVASEKEAVNIFSKIKKVAEVNIGRHLNLEYFGKIANDRMVAISIKKRTLFVKENPYTQATQDLEQVARKLAKNLEKNMLINNEPNSRGLAGLFYRLVKHFN